MIYRAVRSGNLSEVVIPQTRSFQAASYCRHDPSRFAAIRIEITSVVVKALLELSPKLLQETRK
jgi:hypothetical protein